MLGKRKYLPRPIVGAEVLQISLIKYYSYSKKNPLLQNDQGIFIVIHLK